MSVARPHEPLFRIAEDTIESTAFGTGPWDPGALHGGAPAGLLAYLASRLPAARPMQLARLTIDIMRPVPIGQLRVEHRILREGRNIQLAEFSLFNGDKQCLHATALRVREEAQALPPHLSLPANPFPPPEAVSKPVGFLNAEGYNKAVEARAAIGGFGAGYAACWMRYSRPWVEGAENTPLMIAAATGDYTSGFGVNLDFKAWTYINADLSLHFARPPAGEWMLLESESLIGPDGVGVTQGRLWDRAGLFGRASQTLVVAPR